MPRPKHFLLLLPDVEQFHIKNQRCVGRDRAAGSTRSVGKARRNPQLPLAADLHSRNALVPALDDFSGAQLEDERLAAVARAVKLLACGEKARIVDLDSLSNNGRSARANHDVPVLE